MFYILEKQHGERVFGLDVFRAVAIIIVVMGHGAYMIDKALPGFPWIPLIDGVELFFVLSGFLIGSILIKQISRSEFGVKELFTFWKRRWFRTLPNYYLILLINILFVTQGWIDGSVEDISYKFFLFIQNFSSGFVGFFWESWSLSIEEWFYIFLPLLLIAALYFLKPKSAFFGAIILLVSIPLCYRIYQSDMNVDKFWWDVNFRKVVLTRLDAIGYGVLAAGVKFYYSEFWKKGRFIFFVLGLIALIIIPLFPISPNQFYAKTFYFSITSFSAMLLLPFADNVQKYKSNFFGKTITHISKISYSMYLINLALVSQVIAKYFMPVTALEGLFTYLIYWTVILLFSSILFKYFEEPVMKLRDRK